MDNDKRWVLGTKNDVWHLVDKNDRDYAYGFTDDEIVQIGGFHKARQQYLAPFWLHDN